MQTPIGILVATALLFPLAACDRSAGPAEQAGERVDQAVEETREQVEQAAEKVGETVEQAGDAVREETSR